MDSVPGKVKAAAVILFILAGLTGVFSLLAIYMGLRQASGPAGMQEDVRFVLDLSGLAVAFAIGYVVLGVLLLQGRNWARIATIALMALSIVTELAIWVLPLGGSATPSCPAIVLPIVVIALLNSDDSRHFFASRAEQRAESAALPDAAAPGTPPTAPS